MNLALKIKTTTNIFTWCLYFLTLNRQIIGLNSFITSNLRADELQIGNCPTSKFQCKNGQCVAESFLCDGIPDCKDGSDEVESHCQNMSCDEEFFQCDYGACIKKEYLCDGLKQCVDGSDEWTQTCVNKTKDELGRNKREAGNSCPTPSLSADKTIKYLCDGKESDSCGTEKGFVPEYTEALLQCNQNYQQREGSQNRSICHKKNWIPPIDKCYKICDRLTPVNVQLQCYYKGTSVNCDEDNLISGTKVRPTCSPLHKYNDFTPNYLEMTCRDDGTWDNALFKCTPECGRQYTNSTTLIQGGIEDKVGNSPWHVAIYNRENVLICGGTLISSNLVVSAAHCFHEQISNRKQNASEFEVIVGKFTRDYSKFDNENQQTFKIKEIRETNKGYIGRNNYFTGDIAVLILEDKIRISPTVLPACVDWIGLRNRQSPADGSLAKVSGWGMDEAGKYSSTLRTASLPYINRERCLNTVPDDFKAFITFDKFCAGSEKGIGVLQGDSGGGLLFQQENFYYLRGVVSTKHASSTAIATFTDLADHIEWIIGIRNELEREVDKKPDLSSLLREANTAITSKIRDLPKLLQLSERLEKEISDQEVLTHNLKLQAQSTHQTLKNSMQASAIETFTDAFLTDRLTTISKFGSDLGKVCFECFRKVVDKAVDNVSTKLRAKELIAMVKKPEVFRSAPERISISAAIFNKVKQNGDMNSDSSIQLAYYIKETMEMTNYEAAQADAKSLMKHIQYNLPKSVKNLVFSSKICIRNVEYNEYLYASDAPGEYDEIDFGGRHTSSDYDRRHVYTWKGSLLDPKESAAFAWKLEPYGEGYQILNAKYDDRMYSGVPKWDVQRRYVFTWRKIEDGSFVEGAWKFEPDGDYVYIRNTHQNEYLFADFDRFRNDQRRFVFTFIPKQKPQLDSKWMIIACPNQ